MEDHEIFIAEANREVSVPDAKQAVATLKRWSRSLHRIYVRQCNGYHTLTGACDEQAAQDDRVIEECLEKRVRSFLNAYGIGLYLNADPRGNPIGMLTPKSGRYNTMGGREAGWRL